ncbi:MAG: coiled-coil domain-containing protein [Alphaproteobacteria bacterium]
MALATFDTHELVKDLKAAGFTEDQAEAVTRAVKNAREIDFSDLASKADLAVLDVSMTGMKTEIAGMKTEIAGMKTEIAGMKTEIAGMKTDITNMKTDIAGIKGDVAVLSTKLDNFAANYATKAELSDMRNDIIRWVFGIALGQAALIITLLKLLPGLYP